MSRYFTARLLAGAAVLALAPALTSQAAAQTSDDGADVAADEGEIIVTAQKREQNLQDVPISMAVVGGEMIDAFHANDFKQIMNYVPNVFVQSTAGNDVIYIRGFGSPPANFGFDQSVSLYVDGVYAGRSRQAQAPFFDLGRVEVLRGPQGALFGKNTAAGAVSVVSAAPTRHVEGSLNLLYNFDFKGVDVSGYVSGPVTDTLSARFAYKIVQQDGYMHNLATDHADGEQRQKLARLTVKWEPSDSFDYTTKLEYVDRDIYGGITVASPLTTRQQPRLTRYVTQTDLGREGSHTESVMATGTGNLSLGDFTLTSVTGYSWFKANTINGFDQTIPGGGYTPNTTANSYPERFDQFSQEIRLLSPTGGTLEYVVGAYYDKSNYTLITNSRFNQPQINYVGAQQSRFKQEAESYSVFGQATLRATEALRLIGSLRYSHTSKDATYAARLVSGPYPIRPVTSAVGSLSEENLDPSATVQYDVAPKVMVYATFGKGSKSGGFVSNTYGTRDATFQFKPERSTNYEIGLKSTLFDRLLDLNISLYNTSFDNLQVSFYNSQISSYQTGNAASASSKGVEASIAIRPSGQFDITASGAYQDIKYDDFPGAPCLASQPLSVCNPADPASVAANNIKGYSPPFASKFSGNVQVHWGAALSDTLKLDTTAIVTARSKFFNADNQSPVYGVQNGYAKIDARVELSDADSGWHLAVIGKNLTNKLTTGSAFPLVAPTTTVSRAILYVEAPRSISVEAGFKF